MGGFLREKLGEGATAEIHAWAPGQVVKLFKAGVPTRWGKHEARMTRAAFTGGAPAPEVYGEVNVDGRFGFVMRRFDGPTLRDLLLAQAVAPEQAGGFVLRPVPFDAFRFRSGSSGVLFRTARNH